MSDTPKTYVSDTPETDATEKPLWGDAQELCLLRELCRKLERERDEAREERDELRKWISGLEVACTMPEGRLWRETFLVEAAK